MFDEAAKGETVNTLQLKDEAMATVLAAIRDAASVARAAANGTLTQTSNWTAMERRRAAIDFLASAPALVEQLNRSFPERAVKIF